MYQTARTIIVTGASGNLGQAIIKKFLSAGDRVIGTVIPNDPVQIQINDEKFETAVINLMDENSSAAFIRDCISKYEKIDAVVLTVGGFGMGLLTGTSTADITKQLMLNFNTAYNIIQPVYTHMLQNNFGRIFLIGARPGLSAQHGKNMVAYSLSKSLLFRLSELINEDAKEKNISATVIVPSIIDTPQNRQSMPEADFDHWVKPESIADIISFQCSPAANAIREPLIKVYGNA